MQAYLTLSTLVSGEEWQPPQLNRNCIMDENDSVCSLDFAGSIASEVDYDSTDSLALPPPSLPNCRFLNSSMNETTTAKNACPATYSSTPKCLMNSSLGRNRGFMAGCSSAPSTAHFDYSAFNRDEHITQVRHIFTQSVQTKNDLSSDGYYSSADESCISENRVPNPSDFVASPMHRSSSYSSVSELTRTITSNHGSGAVTPLMSSASNHTPITPTTPVLTSYSYSPCVSGFGTPSNQSHRIRARRSSISSYASSFESDIDSEFESDFYPSTSLESCTASSSISSLLGGCYANDANHNSRSDTYNDNDNDHDHDHDHDNDNDHHAYMHDDNNNTDNTGKNNCNSNHSHSNNSNFVVDDQSHEAQTSYCSSGGINDNDCRNFIVCNPDQCQNSNDETDVGFLCGLEHIQENREGNTPNTKVGIEDAKQLSTVAKLEAGKNDANHDDGDDEDDNSGKHPFQSHSVLFLDVDGVLLTAAQQKSQHPLLMQQKSDVNGADVCQQIKKRCETCKAECGGQCVCVWRRMGLTFDTNVKKLMTKLCECTQCDIIISSSWQFFPKVHLPYLYAFLEDCGWDRHRNIHILVELLKINKKTYEELPYCQSRGRYIEQVVRQYSSHIRRYAIFDDLPLNSPTYVCCPRSQHLPQLILTLALKYFQSIHWRHSQKEAVLPGIRQYIEYALTLPNSLFSENSLRFGFDFQALTVFVCDAIARACPLTFENGDPQIYTRIVSDLQVLIHAYCTQNLSIQGQPSLGINFIQTKADTAISEMDIEKAILLLSDDQQHTPRGNHNNHHHHNTMFYPQNIFTHLQK